MNSEVRRIAEKRWNESRNQCRKISEFTVDEFADSIWISLTRSTRIWSTYRCSVYEIQSFSAVFFGVWRSIGHGFELWLRTTNGFDSISREIELLFSAETYSECLVRFTSNFQTRSGMNEELKILSQESIWVGCSAWKWGTVCTRSSYGTEISWIFLQKFKFDSEWMRSYKSETRSGSASNWSAVETKISRNEITESYNFVWKSKWVYW